MSLFPRLLLAFFATLFGVVMCVVAPPSETRWFFYLFGGFCLSIGALCFLEGRWAHALGGLVASCVVAAALAYLVSALAEAPSFTGRRSDASIVNAVLCVLFFAVPAGRYLWATRFGFVEPPKPWNERLVVEIDDAGARVRPVHERDAEWAQQFAWSDVTRVCLIAMGVTDTDWVVVELKGGEARAALPTEARGGPGLVEALLERGLFPQDLWRRALGATVEQRFCWPPHGEDATARSGA